MGLFSRKKTVKRTEIQELIFCPYRSREEILSVLQQAFHLQIEDTKNPIAFTNGNQEIVFSVFSMDDDDSSFAKDQIEGVWHHFRQAQTRKLEVQRNVLHHLRICRGVIAVYAAYDGGYDAATQEDIMSQIYLTASHLQAILTRGMDSLCDPSGQLLFDKQGNSDLEYYVPPIYPIPGDWYKDASPAECSRREQSLRSLEKIHLYAPSFLPLLGVGDSTSGRSLEEISRRAAALLTVAIYSECRLGEKMPYDQSKDFIHPIIEAFGIQNDFSPKEHIYLSSPHSAEQEQVQFSWQYEALWVMEWALGLHDDLFWPDHICDVTEAVRLMHLPDLQTLMSKARLRSQSEILDMADLYYLLHWSCVDARISDLPAPQSMDGGVVLERRRALFWLAGCDDACAWDDVDLST